MDSLGDRIKKYEKASSYNLVPNSVVFIRIDGQAFHTFTRGLEKPYSQKMIDAMIYAASETSKRMGGKKRWFEVWYSDYDRHYVRYGHRFEPKADDRDWETIIF